MQKIILIGGKAGHGKDSSANFIKKYLENKNNKALIIHFADELKFYAKEYFNWNGIKDENGRKLLQTLGTDIVRSRNHNYWVESVARFIEIFQDDFDYFIIPDCRFPNEIDYFKNKKFPLVSIRIKRINYQSILTPIQQLHLSEIALDNYDFDHNIQSENELDKLEITINKFMQDIDI